MIKTISIVGLGYVGLPTAVAFAKAGFKVIGADIKESIVDQLNSKKSTIPEILPDESIAELLDKKKIEFTTDASYATRESDAILITVPTPVTDDKLPDLRAVTSASEAISKGLGKDKLVVLESTVYPGVTEEVVKPILENGSGLSAGEDFGLAYCPERYNPGDTEHTIDRLRRVVGAIDDSWLKLAVDMYSKITTAGILPVSSIKTAEAAKVIENTQRDLNIGLMNELALIFDKIGIDSREVIDAAATKWNFHIYYPGPGVGGHCLPVDPYYLVHKSRELGYEPEIITAGRRVNDYMAAHVVDLTTRLIGELKGKKIAVLGSSYKGNVGDARETPAKRICTQLNEEGAEVFVYDPLVQEKDMISWGVNITNFEDAITGSECIILHSDHDEFKNIDLNSLSSKVAKKAIVDTRGLIDKGQASSLGFLLARI